jgi:hypothetical protein
MGKFSASDFRADTATRPAARLADPRRTPDPRTPAVAVPEQQAPATAPAPELARAVLIAGLVAGAGIGLSLAMALAGPVAQEADLARLLRAMIGVKGLILLGAAALVLLRLRGPVGRPALLGYAGSLGLSAAALGWLWGLSGLALGSVLFYGGLFLAYRVASADPLLMQALRPRRPA